MLVKTLAIISLVMFLLGFALMVRAARAAPHDRAKYLRAAAGAMAAAAGNILVLRMPTFGLILLLAGIWLIFGVGRKSY